MDGIFHNDKFYGSEIVITGLNIRENAEAQCANR
jgi:hypothetical protein